ncbi:MAG: sigma-70 family RNA polymerase sigma factor [Planctomycetes bacterium]|nr:sigma-70 family RNA polymerase sigma factor [Planctomycetota bacterium]
MDRDNKILLKAIAEGDRKAFEQLYRTYKDGLFSAVLSLLDGDRAASEDVLHDVFVTLAERAGKLELTSTLKNYLLACSLNRARDILRRRTRERICTERLGNRIPESTESFARLEFSEELSSLMAALASLPDKQRDVVVLHIHGQLKFREIAEMLGISPNTAQSRYRYALSALRKLLAETEV